MKSIKSFLKKAALFGLAVALCSGILTVALSTSKVSAENEPETKVIDNTPAHIEALKDSVVDRLSSCESAGHDEDYGLVTFDQNSKGTLSARNTPSFGVMQFKVTTVQKYVKDQTGKDINGHDAIILALDAKEAKDLAKWVIFNVQGGIYNWQNCADKLDLVGEVTVIKKLN